MSAFIALSSIGLFCGILGYVFGHISLDVSIMQPRVYRDYWSNLLHLGKSDKREYSNIDRKLSGWSLGKKGWWKNLVGRLVEPIPEVVFVSSSKKDSLEANRGDLFDISSGRRVGECVLDPSDLTSKFRPKILKVAELSASPKGVRRLALERIIDRFLARLIPSRGVWIFYFSLSALLTVSVYVVWMRNLAAYVYYEGADVQVVFSAIICCAIVLFFVWRWRNASKILFERRPDERILIFVVYLILALLYGFCYEVIVYPPGDLIDWAGSWFVWTRWFFLLSLLLGFGYIAIHRECEVVNTYYYDNNESTANASVVSPFKNSQDEPFWLKEAKSKEDRPKAYWVLRFTYFWRYELAKVPHPDWERVEVWIDAEKGKLEWVVTDYHYRELWYKVRGNLQVLYVRFLLNFHTPIPITDSDEADTLSLALDLETNKFVKILFSRKYSQIINSSPLALAHQNWNKLHPAEWIQKYGLPSVAANFCSNLSWTYWRYPLGTEETENYLQKPAATQEDEPETI